LLRITIYEKYCNGLEFGKLIAKDKLASTEVVKVKKTIFFVVLLFMLFSYNASAKTVGLIRESGFVIGYGNGHIGSIHKVYRPLLLIYHVGFDAHKLFPNIIPDSKGKFTFYLEPQFNPLTKPSSQYEFGIGVGAEYRFNILHGLDGYVMGGSGPHYISFDSKGQAKGFIFNDTLGFGLYIHIFKHSALNVGLRFRHISNAGIKKPNHGINNYFGTIGYSLFFN